MVGPSSSSGCGWVLAQRWVLRWAPDGAATASGGRTTCGTWCSRVLTWVLPRRARLPVLQEQERKSRVKGIEAVKGNIQAAKAVSRVLRTSLGPKGMDKLLQGPDGDIVISECRRLPPRCPACSFSRGRSRPPAPNKPSVVAIIRISSCVPPGCGPPH